MHHIRRFLLRLRSVLRPHGHDSDLAREMSAHLTLLEDEYRRRGMSRDEARRQARVTFSGSSRRRNATGRAVFSARRRAARRAVRGAAPAADAGVRRHRIASLASGIGATRMVFTAVNALLARTAAGVADPDRLVDISRMVGNVGVEPITSEQYIAIRERVTRVQDVYAYALTPTPMSWRDGSGSGAARAVFADLVSPNFFTALGVTPAAGRLFTESERAPVVVLSTASGSNYDGNRRWSAPRASATAFTVIRSPDAKFHGNTLLAPDLVAGGRQPPSPRSSARG